MSVIDSSCMGESSLSCPNVSSVKASSADEKGGCRFEVLESSFFFYLGSNSSFLVRYSFVANSVVCQS